MFIHIYQIQFNLKRGIRITNYNTPMEISNSDVYIASAYDGNSVNISNSNLDTLLIWSRDPVSDHYTIVETRNCVIRVFSARNTHSLIASNTTIQDYYLDGKGKLVLDKSTIKLHLRQYTSFDIVALGSGGRITLTFDPPVENGTGWDFAVFENSFSDQYLELAYVEVSSNGIDFIRFDAISLTINPVPGFGNIDPTDVDGLAGKYRQGFGTPFDLENIADKADVLSGLVDLTRISHIRIVDVVGDGSALDATSEVIYDPYPTTGSAGFDLDALGVSNGAPYPVGEYVPPELPPEDGDAGFGKDTGCFVETISKMSFSSISAFCSHFNSPKYYSIPAD